MAWWKRLGDLGDLDSRTIKTPPVSTAEIPLVKGTSLRKLNAKDIETIKCIELQLISAGVLADGGEGIEVVDSFEEILQIAADQGLSNVADLIKDLDLDERISHSTGGDNLLLDELDDYADIGYTKPGSSSEMGNSDVEIFDGGNGEIFIRLPDGTVISGSRS